MDSIETIGWYIFLIVTAVIILYFNWRFLNETKRMQEKMKGMKSFSDIIDATNQALDEFNEAFEEAGKLLETKRIELGKLIERAEGAIARLESTTPEVEQAGLGEQEVSTLNTEAPAGGNDNTEPAEGERVDLIRRYLAEGKTAQDISRITGASIREVELVGKFSN